MVVPAWSQGYSAVPAGPWISEKVWKDKIHNLKKSSARSKIRGWASFRLLDSLEILDNQAGSPSMDFNFTRFTCSAQQGEFEN